MHMKKISGLSLYDCITSYLSISEDEIEADENLLTNITNLKIKEYQERIKRLDIIFKVSGNPTTSPLKILDIQNGSLESEQLLNEQINSCCYSLDVWKKNKNKFSSFWGFSIQETNEGIKWVKHFFEFLVSLPYFSSELFFMIIDGRRLQLVKESVEAGIRRDCTIQKLTSKYTSEVIKIDEVELEDEWNFVMDKWFLPRFFAKKAFFKKMRV